jgi:hypothetical protein
MLDLNPSFQNYTTAFPDPGFQNQPYNSFPRSQPLRFQLSGSHNGFPRSRLPRPYGSHYTTAFPDPSFRDQIPAFETRSQLSRSDPSFRDRTNPRSQLLRSDPSLPDPSLPDPSLPDPSLPDPSFPDPGFRDPSFPDPGFPDPGFRDPGFLDRTDPRSQLSKLRNSFQDPSFRDHATAFQIRSQLSRSDPSFPDQIPAFQIRSQLSRSDPSFPGSYESQIPAWAGGVQMLYFRSRSLVFVYIRSVVQQRRSRTAAFEYSLLISVFGFCTCSIDRSRGGFTAAVSYRQVFKPAALGGVAFERLRF